MRSELDYLYELSYELKYQGRWFHLFTAFEFSNNFWRLLWDNSKFSWCRRKKLAEELDFERTDRFYYTKTIYRKDIEALKS